MIRFEHQVDGGSCWLSKVTQRSRTALAQCQLRDSQLGVPMAFPQAACASPSSSDRLRLKIHAGIDATEGPAAAAELSVTVSGGDCPPVALKPSPLNSRPAFFSIGFQRAVAWNTDMLLLVALTVAWR